MTRCRLVAILHHLDQLPVSDRRRWRAEAAVLRALDRGGYLGPRWAIVVHPDARGDHDTVV